MLDHSKDPEKPRVLLIGPTGILAIIVGGATSHSDFGIKPGSKLLRHNDKSKDAIRNKLLEVKFLIIDELPMESSVLWTYINSRLGGAFVMIPKKAFASF